MLIMAFIMIPMGMVVTADMVYTAGMGEDGLVGTSWYCQPINISLQFLLSLFTVLAILALLLFSNSIC